MLASDAHGTPLGKRAACWSCCVPAAMSVTVPLITTLLPIVCTAGEAETVIALGPRPTQ